MPQQTFVISAGTVTLKLPATQTIVAHSQEEAEIAMLEWLRVYGEVETSSVIAESLEEVCAR